MFRWDRRVSRGGGVFIFVKNSINCKQMEWSRDDLEWKDLQLTLSVQMYKCNSLLLELTDHHLLKVCSLRN